MTSDYDDRDAANVTRNIVLKDFEGETVDTQAVELPSTLGEEESTTRTLIWQTDPDDHGDGNVTVSVEDQEVDKETTIREPDESEEGIGDAGDPLFGDGLEDAENTTGTDTGGTGESEGDSDDDDDPHIDIDIDGVEVD